MNESQTANLSETVSSQKSGIVLCWSRYVSGSAVNYGCYYSFIPKSHVKVINGAGVYCKLSLGGNESKSKYVNIHDDHLTGHANNADSLAKNFVLRYVTGC